MGEADAEKKKIVLAGSQPRRNLPHIAEMLDWFSASFLCPSHDISKVWFSVTLSMAGSLEKN